MAKKKSSIPYHSHSDRLTGKTLAFVGPVGTFSTRFHEPFYLIRSWVEEAGATVVDYHQVLPDILVTNPTQKNPAGLVAKLVKRSARLVAVDLPGLLRLLLPSPAELLDYFRRDEDFGYYKWWDNFDAQLRIAGPPST